MSENPLSKVFNLPIEYFGHNKTLECKKLWDVVLYVLCTIFVILLFVLCSEN